MFAFLDLFQYVSCKTQNSSQTSQITHKPPTNQPNPPQTSQIPNKSLTNQQKITSFFP